jgi:hypothetical protein
MKEDTLIIYKKDLVIRLNPNKPPEIIKDYRPWWSKLWHKIYCRFHDGRFKQKRFWMRGE